MKNIVSPPVTTYTGFSKVSGSISLDSLFELIGSTTYKHLIDKIDLLVRDGKMSEINNVKRQLPFFTVTACYREKRLPESIERYNDLITIDIDGLTDEQVATLRPIIEQDGATIGNFLTAKQHGLKAFSYVDNEQTQPLRQKLLKKKSITYRELENYHSEIYEITRRHYEELLGVKVDTSGKDISRGVFASYDPHAFFSAERMAKVKPFNVQIIPPEPSVVRRGAKSKLPPKSTVTAREVEGIDPITKSEFNKCVASVRRHVPYEDGNHNPFLFLLGNTCFKRGLPENDVKLLARHYFGENGKWDTDTPIGNGFTYTSKTEKAEVEKRRPVIELVKDFLNKNFRVKHNALLDRLDIMFLKPETAGEGAAPDSEPYYRIMTDRDINTIFCQMSEAGIKYSYNNLKTVLQSSFAQSYDPIRAYFNDLPAWDDTTDYIGQLADTIQTNDQTFWKLSFRRWLVALVACALNTGRVNQLMLVLSGGQGKGKSTWIRNLLPPELKEYYSNGMIDPRKKDDMLLLTNRILINIEEFEGVKPQEAAMLKRLTGQDSLTQRDAFKFQALFSNRRASFVASTNNVQVLSDITGSRRFLMTEAQSIDYRTPVNHRGVYSQALALIASGYQFWFEGEEIETINQRNEEYRMKDPLEENLYIYYQPGKPTSTGAKWLPAAAMLTYLSIMGRTLVNIQAQQLLVLLLERGNFVKRKNRNGITEYCVVVQDLGQGG